MKRSRLINWLLIVFTVMIGFIFNTQTAQAATYGNEFITSGAITNGPNFSYASNVNVRYDWAVPSDVHIAANDQMKIQLPDALRVSKESTFPLLADDGTELGTVDVKTDGTMVVTFNETAATLTNLHGTITFSTKLNAATVGLGEQNVPFETNNGTLTSPVIVSPSTNNLSKKGSFTTDSNGNPAIKWTILVNRNELPMENVKVSDIITDAGQQLVPDSITVSNGHWTDPTTQASYKRDETLTAGTDYTVSVTGDSFETTFAKLDSQMVVIDYLTTFKDPAVASDGSSIFKNTATMTWGGSNGNGANSEKATASVKQTAGSGTGSGSENNNSGEESNSSSDSNNSNESSTSESSNASESSNNSSSENSDSSSVESNDHSDSHHVDTNHTNESSTDNSVVASNDSSASQLNSSNQSSTSDNRDQTVIADPSNSSSNGQSVSTKGSAKQKDSLAEGLPHTGQQISISLIIVGVISLTGLIIYRLRQN
ncbi:Ig-like domain-containing protein [Furfurilactobacillus rossiae]|nr:Ig-like domain-containing protein [Furfurilactobacillus rossiae]QFR66924.1 LPXTG cell wall anchor domain-containing protein [Furfurilactobacillus rossiae]QLE62421.1 LPXTG cell wall anchor domain-containing protein [Furfurilactobacillus rossiae]